MNKSGKIILGALGIGALYAMSRANTVQQAVNVTVTSIDINSPTSLTANLNIFNPTRSSINIDSINADVIFNGVPIGKLQYINKTPIAALANTVWKVPVILSLGAEITVAEQIINQGATTGVINVQGLVYIGGVGMPFQQTTKLW